MKQNVAIKSPDASWNPEAFLKDRTRELLARHYGVGGSEKQLENYVRALKGKGEVTFGGLRVDGKVVASVDAVSLWIVRKLCSSPDGIAQVLDVEPDRAGMGSPTYHACLETMRTSRGTFFSAEEIAIRIHYKLEPNRKRRLRQLRRTLVKVCRENGARIRKENKATTRYGFR